MSLIKSRLPFVVIAASMILGCGQDRQQSTSIVFGISDGTCKGASFMKQSVPAGVNDIAIRLTDDTGKAFITKVNPQEIKKDGLIIPELVPGDYKMDIAACGDGARALYGTTIPRITVTEDQKTGVRAFLPGLDAINCVGGTNTSLLVPNFDGDSFNDTGQNAFACAVMDQGKYWLFGGFNSITPGTDVLTAGSAVWQYRPDLGLFIKPLDSNENPMTLPGPWAAGHCMGTQDGVLLIGGVESGRLGPDKYPGSEPPVLLNAADTTAKTAYLVGENSDIKKIDLPIGIYPYASVTPLDSGSFMACGGRESNGKVINTCTVFTQNAGKITNSVPINLNTGRYGHSAVRLNSGKVLLIGGFSPSAKSMPLELIDPSTRQTQTITESSLPWTVFQSAWIISHTKNRSDILIIGGNDVNPGPSNTIISVTGHATLLTLDDTNPVKISVSDLTPSAGTGYWVNSMASVGTLSNQPLLAYGFRSFTSRDDADCKGSNVCMPRSINILGLSDNKLSVVRTFSNNLSGLGAASLNLDDNSVILVGGIVAADPDAKYLYKISKTATLITSGDGFKELCSVK